MFKNMSYNQRKLTRLIVSIILICAFIFEFLTKDYLPEIILDILVIAALILFIVGDRAISSGQKNAKKIMLDEMAWENEAKAAQFTNTFITLIICIGLLFTKSNSRDVMLSYNMLYCILIAIPAVSDGYYLYLEKGNNNADTEDED